MGGLGKEGSRRELGVWVGSGARNRVGTRVRPTAIWGVLVVCAHVCRCVCVCMCGGPLSGPGTWHTAVTHPVGSRFSRVQGGALGHGPARRGLVRGLDQSATPVDTAHGSQ